VPPQSDPITRAVVTGGHVVDEWIRQAQQTARLLGGNALNLGWADDSSRLVKTASDAMATWLAMFGLPQANVEREYRNGASGAPTTEPAAPTSVRSEPGLAPPPVDHAGPDGATRVSVNIEGGRHCRVSVDVRLRQAISFRVLDLRPDAGDAPRIQHVTLCVGDTGEVQLNLAVPQNQPPGTYRAVVLDAVRDMAIGTITLRLSD
jgi:hypothetical protein